MARESKCTDKNFNTIYAIESYTHKLELEYLLYHYFGIRGNEASNITKYSNTHYQIIVKVHYWMCDVYSNTREVRGYFFFLKIIKKE